MDTQTENIGPNVLAGLAIAVDFGLAGVALCGLIPCGPAYALQAATIISLLTLGTPVLFAIAIAVVAGWLAPPATRRAIAWSPLVAAAVFAVLAALPHTGAAAGFCRIDL